MSLRPRSDAAPASRAAADRLSAVLAAGQRFGSPLPVAVPTEGMKRGRDDDNLVVDRKHWELYLRYDLLLKLHDKEDHRFDDDERFDYDYVSKKEKEVEEKQYAAREAFESVYPDEYDTFQLTDYEDPGDLEERIEKVFSDEFDGGYPETYATDDVIERLVKKLIDGTPSE
jgi:hypothetical protein